MSLLEGITIIDLSHRLPGPLAGHLLQGLGAKVIKIEDHVFKDAFIYGLFADMDHSFPAWYEELNENKEVIRMDFKDPATGEKIREYIASSDGVIMGVPPKVRNKLGLNNEDIEKIVGDRAIIELGASKKKVKAMHDVNALAMTGFLELYTENKSEEILDPPFMPFAGISFGNKAATDLVAAILKAKTSKQTVFHTSYLFETTQEIYSPFWPKKMRESGEKKFLHNGRYPCYTLYRLKDGKYVALAAVEEKFWVRFCEVFNLSIPSDKRFYCDDRSVFESVYNAISMFDSKDLASKIEAEDFCLTIV